MADPADLRAPLLTWYDEHKRVTPWRVTKDPYAVWVSEIMLQQTRVDTVIDYFNRFMARFPTIDALAAAPIDDVLKLWQGLGYYARARNLHRAAQIVASEHGGEVPRDAATLRALPGLGAYTVGAIRSIVFGEPAAVVDGNVIRVLTRVFEIPGDPTRSSVNKAIWEIAEAAVDPDRPGDFNQGLMELGATACKPARPACEECPIETLCGARATETVGLYPSPKRKTKVTTARSAVAAVRRRGKLLLVRRKPEGLLGGLWELPSVECKGREKPATALRRRLEDVVGLEVEDLDDLNIVVEHQFSHLHMTYTALGCKARGRARARQPYDATAWVPPEDLTDYGVGAATRRILKAISAVG